jgi:Pvc16 N-terminal domain
MFTHILGASLTLQSVLQESFVADPGLAALFGGGGTATVSLATPDGMEAAGATGLSLWLYRLIRDEQTLNRPPLRVPLNLIRRQPLPIRLHYLMTPILSGRAGGVSTPETEQLVIGRVLQTLHDKPLISGPDLKGSYGGTALELAARLETLGLDETSRIWEGLERPYQLSVSYEVSIVVIASELAPASVAPVKIVMPQIALGQPGSP